MDNTVLRTELARLHCESYGWALVCCANNLAEAEEALQNAYLKVLDGRAQFRGQSQFKTWLLGVIRITAANERRLRLWRRLRLSDYAQRAEAHPTVERPDALLCRAEARAQLRQAMARLPQRQRQVLQLAFYHDLSLFEAAAVMGISIGSARTHYERGKQALREWIYETKTPHENAWRRTSVSTVVQ